MHEQTTPTDDQVYLNGIDAVTGEYLVKPLKCSEIASVLKSGAENTSTVDADGLNDPSQISWLRRIWRTIIQPHLGLRIDVDPADVKQAGWGIIFHQNESQAVKDALQPLINHRRQQIGDEQKVKVLDYRAGERRGQWLARNGVGSGTVNPTKVPYYLLVVGSPAQIPFSFCHLLDVEYGVGLLHFDTADEYVKYVKSVIAYETKATVPNAREAVFFATRHSGDRATELSADYLVNPLADGGPNTQMPQGVAGKWGFRSRKLWGSEATKAALAGVLSPAAGSAPPALLFTASHGMGLPKGHAEQHNVQGALLCQDWPGLGSISPDDYFAAKDVSDESRVHGMIIFCFACFGAGTPSHDRFIHQPGQPPPSIADASFVSSLPKRLLSHPRGGALAFIGHVERAWGYSIGTPTSGTQIQPFENAIGRILKGEPLGYAMKDFNERFAALATSLSSMLEEISFGAAVSNYELAASWIERNDAEGYVVIGDPAIQLRVDDLH